MKPKRTDKTEHDSRSGRSVPPVADSLEQIEKALGRPLESCEEARVRALVMLGRDLRLGEDAAPLGDVRHTLKIFGAMSDDQVREAITKCDSVTYELIADRMRSSAGLTIQKAASEAYAALPGGASGAPARWYQREIARRIVPLWASLRGSESSSTWSYDSNGSPLALFAQGIFSLVEGRKFDLRKAVRLIRDMTTEG